MKKIFLLMTILFFNSVISAQTFVYDTCNLQFYSKFEGDWRYVNGSDTIRITIRKYRFQYQNQPPGSTTIDVIDRLFGWHEYKQGSNVIESNYSFRNPPFSFDEAVDSASIVLGFIGGTCNDNTRNLKGNIIDYTQAREVKQVWVTLSTDGNTLYWKQEHSEGFGAFTGAYGMTLPRQFTLTRQ